MALESDIEVAEVIRLLDRAIIVVGGPPVAFAIFDAWLIRHGYTSWSRHTGGFGRKHPVIFGAILEATAIGIYLHCTLESRFDFINAIGRWLRR